MDMTIIGVIAVLLLTTSSLIIKRRQQGKNAKKDKHFENQDKGIKKTT